MIKLSELLKEIGETTKPYPFTTTYSGVRGGSARREYNFVNSNYDTIEVEILVDIHGEERINGTLHEGPEFTVLFSVLGSADSEDEDGKFKEMTGSGDALRVLSTVVACVKDAADKLYGSLDEVLTITFKGDDKRFNTYLRYAQKQLPAGWIIQTAEGDDRITLINTNVELGEGLFNLFNKKEPVKPNTPYKPTRPSRLEYIVDGFPITIEGISDGYKVWKGNDPIGDIRQDMNGGKGFSTINQNGKTYIYYYNADTVDYVGRPAYYTISSPDPKSKATIEKIARELEQKSIKNGTVNPYNL